MTDVHLQVEMANDRHETILFLVEAQDIFFKVQCQLKLVTTLLDEENVLRCVVLIV